MRQDGDKNQQSMDSDEKFAATVHLDTENRWVRLSRIIPWDSIEEIYVQSMSLDTGRPAIPARIAFGALFIKEMEGLTDRECVREIQENPYMQHFLGLEQFQHTPLFSASAMSRFRKRFPEELMDKMRECIRTGKWPEDTDAAGNPE